ncbi:MAG TPA: hypothetical protein VLE95_02775 [Chlamydiales bacterium]|nr:hypothetical protein [Chlamydiales bacterium]
MAKSKLADKFKEGMSVHELEGFASKHTTELFSILAIIIGAISSAYDFFTGPRLTIFFLSAGALIAILFSAPVERGLKQLYRFAFKQEKITEIIFGLVKIIVAIFIPFIFFGFLGLLAGTSYHYYIRHAQVLSENHPAAPRESSTEDEYD